MSKLNYVSADCWQAIYLDGELLISDNFHIHSPALIRALALKDLLPGVDFHTDLQADKNPEEAPEKIEDI